MPKRKISELHPHPRQQEIGDLTDADLRALADDIQTNGLRDPVEITSGASIVAGHQRVRAAKLLGWTEIAVEVRTDLESKGKSAVEAYFFSSNLNRRQLDPVKKARLCKALYELQDPNPNSGDLRDYIGERLGISGRTLSRHMRVLQTPQEVQDAYSAGHLSLVLAGKVVGLPAHTQAEIARLIREGRQPKEVITAALIDAQVMSRSNRDGNYGRLLRSLTRVVKTFRSHVQLHDCDASASNLAVFEAVATWINERIDWERAALMRQESRKKRSRRPPSIPDESNLIV